jgi:photosystem II stability/assembly factor-like uncharacterized protein
MIAPLLVAAAVAAAPTAIVVSNAKPQTERVALTTDGRSWRDVSPPRTGWIDDATFIDASHGWVVSEDSAAAKGRVARTTDGGRTWRSVRFGGHSCSAGSQFLLEFVDARHGWIVDVEASGGFSRLWRTIDGGRTWRVLVERMPGLGPVAFRTRTEGWTGGYDGLYRSRDGGRWWRRVQTVQRGSTGFFPPRFYGRTAVAAAVSTGAPAAFAYRTTDGGRHWQRTLQVRLPAEPLIFGPVSLSAPRPGVCWLTVAGSKSKLYVSVDGGRSWARRQLPSRGRLEAIDARTAVVAVRRAPRDVVLVTHDGGRSWRPR